MTLNRNSLLLFAILMCVHMDIALTASGQFLAPSFPAFVLCLLALVTQIRFIPRRSIVLLVTCLSVVFLTTTTQAIQFGNFVDRMRSAALLAYTFIMGLGLLALLKSQGVARTYAVISLFLGFLFLGTLLELYTDFAAISNSISEALHGWNFVYDAAERDLRNYGAVRPKLFASEPSKLGITFAVMISILSSLSYRKLGLVASLSLCLLLSAAAIYLVRSPTIMYGAAAGILLVFFQHARTKGSIKRLVLIVGFFGFSALLLLPYAVDAYINSLQFGETSALTSRSWQRRIIYPAFFARDYLVSHPLLGSGFGDDIILTKEMIQYFYGRGLFFLFPDLKGLGALNLVTNAFYLWLCQMGLLGSLLFILPFRAFCQSENVKYVLPLLLCVALIWQTIGSISSPISWMPIFLYVWLCSVTLSARFERSPNLGKVHYTNTTDVLGAARPRPSLWP